MGNGSGITSNGLFFSGSTWKSKTGRFEIQLVSYGTEGILNLEFSQNRILIIHENVTSINDEYHSSFTSITIGANVRMLPNSFFNGFASFYNNNDKKRGCTLITQKSFNGLFRRGKEDIMISADFMREVKEFVDQLGKLELGYQLRYDEEIKDRVLNHYLPTNQAQPEEIKRRCLKIMKTSCIRNNDHGHLAEWKGALLNIIVFCIIPTFSFNEVEEKQKKPYGFFEEAAISSIIQSGLAAGITITVISGYALSHMRGRLLNCSGAIWRS
jgi:hypothetical protein